MVSRRRQGGPSATPTYKATPIWGAGSEDLRRRDAYTVMAYTVMGYIVMASIVMAYIVVAYMVMAFFCSGLYSYGLRRRDAASVGGRRGLGKQKQPARRVETAMEVYRLLPIKLWPI